MESRFGGADFSNGGYIPIAGRAIRAQAWRACIHARPRHCIRGRTVRAGDSAGKTTAGPRAHACFAAGRKFRRRCPKTASRNAACDSAWPCNSAWPTNCPCNSFRRVRHTREAAFTALTIANPKSIMSGDLPGSPTGFEYGGLIFKLGDKYHFTEPIQGEEKRVEVWDALSLVPAEARTSIVGDYHAHGNGKNEKGEYIGEGEDFSGRHPDPISMMSLSLRERADIGGARKDIETRPAILDPKTFTSYLATPRGRFAIFIPAQDIVFSFSPDSRLLPLDKKTPSGASIDDHPLCKCRRRLQENTRRGHRKADEFAEQDFEQG